MKTDIKKAEEYLNKMKQNGFDCSNLVGCTMEEICALEHKYNILLPDSYKFFLLSMGKINNLVDVNEYSIDYQSVLEMTEDEKNFIDEVKQDILNEGLNEEVIELPQNSLLILKRCDGSQFYFLIAEGGEDSPVFYYNSDNSLIQKAHDSFWDVMNMFLEGQKPSS
jgi:SMI1-KNR4 cell-wall